MMMRWLQEQSFITHSKPQCGSPVYGRGESCKNLDRKASYRTFLRVTSHFSIVSMAPFSDWQSCPVPCSRKPARLGSHHDTRARSPPSETSVLIEAVAEKNDAGRTRYTPVTMQVANDMVAMLINYGGVVQNMREEHAAIYFLRLLHILILARNRSRIDVGGVNREQVR